jgi:hypothetical protein
LYFSEEQFLEACKTIMQKLVLNKINNPKFFDSCDNLSEKNVLTWLKNNTNDPGSIDEAKMKAAAEAWHQALLAYDPEQWKLFVNAACPSAHPVPASIFHYSGSQQIGTNLDTLILSQGNTRMSPYYGNIGNYAQQHGVITPLFTSYLIHHRAGFIYDKAVCGDMSTMVRAVCSRSRPKRDEPLQSPIRYDGLANQPRPRKRLANQTQKKRKLN